MNQYTIKVNGKEIPLHFGTWAIMRFCELNGNLDFAQMEQVLTALSYKRVVSLIECGAEHAAKRSTNPVKLGEFDITDWIDNSGGLSSKEVQDVVDIIVKSINPNYQVTPTEKEEQGDEEKKSRSVGMTSESTALKQA